MGGVCASLGGVGVPWGVGLFLAVLCGLPGVGAGKARMAGASVAGLCGCLGGGVEARVAGPGAVRTGGRVWATGSGVAMEG